LKVISFLNHKGGVGKTTLCVNLARAIQIHDDPRSIMIVDADDQGSARDWQNAMSTPLEGIDVIGADRAKTLLASEDIARSRWSSYMLIDTAGDTAEIHGIAISLSHLIIIPVRPSPYDVWATQDTVFLIKTALRINPKLKAVFVLNQCIPNSTISGDVIKALAEFPEIYTLTNTLSHRLSFARSANGGHTVYETKDGLAMKEMDLVTNEILDYLYGKNDGSKKEI
jgi:chromosome partitioning protein